MTKRLVSRSAISATSLVFFASSVVGCSSELPRNDADEVAVSAQAISGEEAQIRHHYRINGVTTKEQRTTISRAGAAIDEVGEDYILITARDSVAESVRALGFAVNELAQSTSFPSADEAYHDYAEMSLSTITPRCLCEVQTDNFTTFS